MIKRPAIVVDASDTSWHLDKKVPIALILAIVLQTGGLVYWAGGVSERLTTLERQAATAAQQPERLVRVEEQLQAVKEGVTEIKTILRAAPMRSPHP